MDVIRYYVSVSNFLGDAMFVELPRVRLDGGARAFRQHWGYESRPLAPPPPLIEEDEAAVEPETVSLREANTASPIGERVLVDLSVTSKTIYSAHGQENHTTVLPLATLTTCRNYPSGCTILECRLDDFNRPVAQILQVPGPDSNVNNQKMGLCVEAKQMSTGPCSRVTSCPIEETCKRNNNNIHCCAGPIVDKIRDVSNNQKNNQRPCSRSNRIKLICIPAEDEENDEEEQLEIEERERCREEEEEEEEEVVICPNIIKEQTETLENILKPGEVLICRPIPPFSESTNCTVNDTIEKFPLECCSRRNGLDSTKSRSFYRPCPADQSTNKQENYICSMRCSKSMDKPRDCTSKNDECRRDIDISSKIVECPSFRKKCCKEELSPSCCSQDSFDCYKDFVSANQLEKYRACRSKRNGLQDECYLPLPRNIKCKIREQCYKNRMEQCYKNRMKQCLELG
ncbi:hypothetical protein HZH66_008719 [Vespula vulgaris]|uniref:Uncharacterized protein n=1 Tax=Vespula vulgaris TaxID=7454 RepID=A0A834JQX0_VESVU|nr:hypothetical protein HZH66_008719 [Vespula vulgaris]